MKVFEGIKYPTGASNEVWFEYDTAPFLMSYLNNTAYKLEIQPTTNNNEFYDGIIVLNDKKNRWPRKWPLGYFKY